MLIKAPSIQIYILTILSPFKMRKYCLTPNSSVEHWDIISYLSKGTLIKIAIKTADQKVRKLKEKI